MQLNGFSNKFCCLLCIFLLFYILYFNTNLENRIVYTVNLRVVPPFCLFMYVAGQQMCDVVITQ
jgi:hypothetical protein